MLQPSDEEILGYEDEDEDEDNLDDEEDFDENEYDDDDNIGPATDTSVDIG